MIASSSWGRRKEEGWLKDFFHYRYIFDLSWLVVWTQVCLTTIRTLGTVPRGNFPPTDLIQRARKRPGRSMSSCRCGSTKSAAQLCCCSRFRSKGGAAIARRLPRTSVNPPARCRCCSFAPTDTRPPPGHRCTRPPGIVRSYPEIFYLRVLLLNFLFPVNIIFIPLFPFPLLYIVDKKTVNCFFLPRFVFPLSFTFP